MARFIKIMTHNMWCKPLYNRRGLLDEMYRKYDPDILLLQETTPRIQAMGFLQDFEDRYTVVLPQIDEYCNNTPLLYKSDSFQLIDSGWHLFDGKNNNNTKSLTWAVLKRKEDGRMLGACSVHFWWQTRSWLDDLCRKYDAEQCLHYVREMTEKYRVPVVLGGDLNCNMSSDAYGCLIENGGVDVRMAAQRYENRINTWHKEPTLEEETNRYAPGPMPAGTHLNAIDHLILFRPEALQVHTLTIPSDQNVLTASDHCPLMMEADFV